MKSVTNPLVITSALLVALGCGGSTTPNDVVQDTGVDTQVILDTVVTDLPPADTATTDATDTAVADVPTDTVVHDYGQVSCFFNSECDPDSFCLATACGNGGTCTIKPMSCPIPDVAAEPVCGCDGIMYDSECNANMVGERIGTDAYCGSNIDCADDAGCGAGEFCKLIGCAILPGKCTTIPWDCTALFAPVCGCNGETYGNACLASAASTGVDGTDIRCEKATCLIDSECGVDGFCFKTSCGALEKGTCETPPAICRGLEFEVCGCDGTTYASECLARKASVSVDATGTVCSASVTCRDNSDCAMNEFCEKATCDTGRGSCSKLPMMCPVSDDPACGCDGVMYSSKCHAKWGRVNTQATAECEGEDTCGLLDSCRSGTEFCLTDTCGGSGTCVVKPATCEAANYPVCGCNDITYKNPCEANKAGTTLKIGAACGTPE